MMSATTPRRTDMSAHNSPTKSPSRRVLGDLTPKAINTPSKHTNAFEPSETMKAFSPLKQVQTLSPHMLTNKENVSRTPSLQAGRKRNIYEVDDAENLDHAIRGIGARDMMFSGTGLPITAAALETIPGNDLGDVNDRQGSPTVVNTPTPESDAEPEPEPELRPAQDPSNSQQSFSEWLDLNECASQPILQMPETDAPSKEKPTKADLLRLRLGLGMYKLKTNQVGKRTSEIMSNWESASSTSNSLNASTSTIATMTTTASSHSIPSITFSPARREPANSFQGQPIPKLSGGPVLLPTAYSQRNIDDYQMPSSPPQAVSPGQLMSPIRTSQQGSHYRTPTINRSRIEEEEEWSEDDGESLTIHQRLQRQTDRRFEQGDITSSAVKGNAAKGLLKLLESKR